MTNINTDANGNVDESKFSVGSFCRAIFSEDGQEYEAVINSINDSEGTQYCEVEFLGYGNVESIWMNDLKPSAGEAARKAQKGEVVAESVDTPDWKVGDACRAIYDEDKQEYEVKIVSVNTDDSGNKYASVEFLGFGNEQTVWLTDIKVSKGEDEVQKQIKLAKGETEDAVDSSSSTVVASPAKVEEEQVKPPEPAPKVAKEVPKPSPEKIAETPTPKTTIANEVLEQRLNDLVVKNSSLEDQLRRSMQEIQVLNKELSEAKAKAGSTSDQERLEKQVKELTQTNLNMESKLSRAIEDNKRLINKIESRNGMISRSAAGDQDGLAVGSTLTIMLAEPGVDGSLQGFGNVIRDQLIRIHPIPKIGSPSGTFSSPPPPVGQPQRTTPPGQPLRRPLQ